MESWYKHPLVWLVIGLPLASILGCFFTIYLAYQGADARVVEHLERQGVLYKATN